MAPGGPEGGSAASSARDETPAPAGLSAAVTVALALVLARSFVFVFFDNLPQAVDVRRSGPCRDGRVVGGFCVVGPPAPGKRVPRAVEGGDSAPAEELPGRGMRDSIEG